jgi:phosphatidate cytidylyltransferase
VSFTRIASAVVLIVAIGGTLLWLPPWGTAALAALAAFAGGIELARLARALGAPVSPAFAGLAAAAFSVVLAVQLPAESLHRDVLVALVIGVTIAAGLITLARTPPGPSVFVSIGVLLLAPLYVGLPLGTIAWVRDAWGARAVIWLIAVIALSDSAQYYAGTLWGRRPLAPVVSPKKTMEGAIGGFVVAPWAGVLVGVWALPGWSPLVTGGLALGLALFGMAGDLFESLLKRAAGAKDSSAIIPGHGGVLDRIDAYLFAAPVFYLFLRYIA